MQGCDATANSSWKIRFSIKTSAWLGLFYSSAWILSTFCKHITIRWKGRHDNQRLKNVQNFAPGINQMLPRKVADTNDVVILGQHAAEKGD